MKKGTMAKRLLVLLLTLACLVNTSGVNVLASGITSSEESTPFTTEALEEDTSEAVTAEETIVEETTAEETTVEETTAEEMTAEDETEETEEETEEETTIQEEPTEEESSAPMLPAPFAAAPRAQSDESVSMNSEGNQTDPQNAIWFFDSHQEGKTFNRENTDNYWDALSATRNQGLTLYSSTDGAIRNDGVNLSGDKEGVLSIDWENGYRNTNNAVGSTNYMKDGYTDGSYTVVGWGGNFEGDAAKNGLRLLVKDLDGTLSDAMSHLTVYLFDTNGNIVDACWVKNADGTGDNNDVNNLRYVSEQDGYYLFEAKLNGNGGIQGMKMAFDRYSNAMGEDEYMHHSGTLLVKNAWIQVGNDWVDFGPFAYYDDPSKYENYFTDPMMKYETVLPFLRSKAFTQIGQDIHAGCNLANKQDGFGWHIWTMSTSDANITTNKYTGDVNALQIKYRDDVSMQSRLYSHKTYTYLNGTSKKNGECLALTLGGDLYLKMGIHLMQGGQNVATIYLSNFSTDMNNPETTKVTDNTFKDNKYHTVYYTFPTDEDYTFDSIEFTFDGATDGKVDFTEPDIQPDGTPKKHTVRNSRFIYVTEVYLLGTSAEITKTVDKTESSPNELLTYQLTVKNNGSETINNFTVEDKLPKWVTFVKSNPEVQHSNGTITWHGTSSLAPNQSTTATITVKVNADTPNRTELINQAVITKLNDKDKTINSNPVKTTILAKTPENYVFYAEVGQKTDLPITLGQTGTVVTPEEPDMNVTTYDITVPYKSDNQASSQTENITIPQGAEVTLTNQDNGGFIFTNIQIGSQTFELTGSKKGDTFEIIGDTNNVYFHDNGNNNPNGTGGLSSFQNGNGKIKLKNVQGGNSVTINLSGVWDHERTFKLTVTAPKESSELTDGKDLIITDIKTDPKYPKPNEPVTFIAVVKNNGKETFDFGNQKKGVSFSVSRVSGNTWNDLVQTPLAPGESRELRANGGNNGATWTPTEAKTYTVTAKVDDMGIHEESNENNNTFTKEITVSNESPEEGSTVADDTFAEIPTKTDLAQIDPVTNPSALTRTDLKYTSSRTGRDEFFVKYHPGGDTTQTKEIKVTVFNYQAADKVYVLDYGLPVDLTANDSNNTNPLTAGGVLKLENDGTTYAIRGIANEKRNTNNIADESDYAISYGVQNGALNLAQAKVEMDYEKSSVIYTPTHFMDSAMTFVYGVQVTKDTEQGSYTSLTGTPVMEGTIKVMPANVVYYEDNFAQSNQTDADGSNGIIINGNHSNETSSGYNGEQSNSLDIQYGYDEAYKDDSELSNGSATLLNRYASAMFRFKGTGFDIISRTNKNTGDIMIAIYDGEGASITREGDVTKIFAADGTLAKPIKTQLVKTYYENGDLYQVPVISWDDLEYGEYVVKLISSGASGNPIYLDGIRIHNPAGTDSEITDHYGSEKDAQILEVRSMILGVGYQFNYHNPSESIPGEDPIATLVQWPGEGNANFLTGVTVTENFTGAYFNNNAGASDNTSNTSNLLSYAIQGPNNELYLGNGYAFAFNAAPDTTPEDNTLQIGVKRVSGTPKLMYLDKTGKWSQVAEVEEIVSSTELYYKISPAECYNGKIVLGVQGDGVLSFTNVKSAGYTFSALEDSDMKQITPTTEDGLLDVTSISVLEPSQNDCVIVTFAAASQVVGVTVTEDSKPEKNISVETASYVFAENGTNTWTIRFKVDKTNDKGKTYTLKAYTNEGKYKTVQVKY